MPLKKSIRIIHRWLGLTTGLIIFIVSITGCIYVFQQEIFEATHKNILFVKTSRQQYLPISILWKKAQEKIGDSLHISSAGIYNDPSKSWSFTAIETNPKESTYFSYYKNFKTVYLDPYTGQHTGTINYKYEFFTVIKWIHQSLLLNYKTGHLIVGWSTLVFVIMLVTGFILWWPKSKYTIKQRLTIKKNTRWRRFNYDLHYVPGFYALLFSLAIAITGLMWSFSWINKPLLQLTTGKSERRYAMPPPSSPGIKIADPLESALQQTRKQFPAAGSYTTSGMPFDSAGTIWVGVRMSKTAYAETNSLFFDQYSGKLLLPDLYKNKSTGERLYSKQYDIHAGTIGGLLTKTLAFMASLICASLPLTGFLIWIGRRNKKRREDNLQEG